MLLGDVDVGNGALSGLFEEVVLDIASIRALVQLDDSGLAEDTLLFQKVLGCAAVGAGRLGENHDRLLVDESVDLGLDLGSHFRCERR